MFDVFDILLPELSTDARLEVRQHQTAFGTSDDRFAYVDGMKFAQVVKAQEVYSNVAARAGSAERANWTVLLVSATANEAAMNDETWTKFLGALLIVLSTHTAWRVICESDCDQHPLEELELSADGLSRLLDSYRSAGFRPLAVQVSTL